MDVGALLDSCSWYDIGNILQPCIKNSLLQTKLKARVNSHTAPHYACINSDHIQHLNFDLSRSLKVKCDGGFGISIYDLLLLFNSNIWLNSAALRDISL